MRSSGIKTGTRKSLTSQAWDGVITFLFKTLIPLIPILGLAYVCSMIINAEIQGVYTGSVPGNGALKLEISEDSDRLSGFATLRTKERYKIVDGKMLDDNKFKLQLQADDATAVGGVGSRQKNDPAQQQLEEVSEGDESAVPKNLKGSVLTEDEKIGPLISIEGSFSFGTMNAQISSDGQSIPFEAKRNTFSALFGWRWWNRTLRYFGIKI